MRSRVARSGGAFRYSTTSASTPRSRRMSSAPRDLLHAGLWYTSTSAMRSGYALTIPTGPPPRAEAVDPGARRGQRRGDIVERLERVQPFGSSLELPDRLRSTEHQHTQH